MYISILLFWETMHVRGFEGGSPDTSLQLNEAREEGGGDCWRLFAVELNISAESTWCGRP